MEEAAIQGHQPCHEATHRHTASIFIRHSFFQLKLFIPSYYEGKVNIHSQKDARDLMGQHIYLRILVLKRVTRCVKPF